MSKLGAPVGNRSPGVEFWLKNNSGGEAPKEGELQIGIYVYGGNSRPDF